MVFIEVSLGVAELELALSAGRAAPQMGSQGKHHQGTCSVPEDASPTAL